ncbi:MAG: ABC transporter permease subunit [Acholeplasmataceae bacterium]
MVFKHELKQQLGGFLIWTGVIGALIFAFMLMFTLFEGELEGFTEILDSMDVILDMFGMANLDISTIEGWFGADASLLLLIGGGMYATQLGMRVLLKEEAEKTADFLLTNPIARTHVYVTKYYANVLYVVIFNMISFIITWISIVIIEEPFPAFLMILYFISNCVLMLVLMTIAYGASAFLRKAPNGIAFGLAIALYVMNSVTNVSEELNFLKYISPFVINESGVIFSEETLQFGFIGYYSVIALLVFFTGWMYYKKKDIYT